MAGHAALAGSFAVMKKIRIHLSLPFEEVLATVLSLPRAHASAASDAGPEGEELKQVLRKLYEAANGRQVETALGLVSIAPPIASFLKEAPFEVGTQRDFVVEARSRLEAYPSELADVAAVPEMIGPENHRFAPAAPKVAEKEKECFSRFIPQVYRSHLPPQGVSCG